MSEKIINMNYCFLKIDLCFVKTKVSNMLTCRHYISLKLSLTFLLLCHSFNNMLTKVLKVLAK